MQGRSGINIIRPAGNAELKNNLLVLINHGDVATLKKAFEDLNLQDEENLLPIEKNTLIIAAQRQNAHAMVIFLKNRFNMRIYLGIQPEPFGESKRVLIGQEPLNTTGDFYHLLAYIALSKSLGYDVPKLVFTYEDTEDNATKLPYSRDLALLNTLGLGDLIEEDIEAEIARLDRSSSNSRRLALRERIEAGHYHLLDQKATTAILAEQCSLFGLKHISALIRPILNKLPQDFSNEVRKYIYRFGGRELSNIRRSAKPYIVMHLRFAGTNHPGYNAQQDLSSGFILNVANFLREKGYEVLFMHSTSRATIDNQYHLNRTPDDADEVIKTALNPFIPAEKLRRSQFGNVGLPNYLSALVEPSGTPEPSQTVDIGKVLHLQFFLKLYRLSEQLQESNRSIKVLANTSGTTDAVAFIGHNVLNIHHFNADRIGQTDYQNYRILTQLAFMSVIRDAGGRHALADIEQWLKGKHIRPGVVFDKSSISELINSGRNKIVMDFAVLCCVLGWPTGGKSNTGVKDDASAELLASATQTFKVVKTRFQQPTVTNSITTFRPLSEEDVLAETFNIRMNLGSS